MQQLKSKRKRLIESFRLQRKLAAEMEKETGVITSLQEADLCEYMQEIITEFRNTKITNSRDEREKES